MHTPKFFLSIFILLLDVLSNVQPQSLLNFCKNYPALIQDEVHQLIRTPVLKAMGLLAEIREFRSEDLEEEYV
ncbi:hypothetical protein [Haliscomenobacter sp.]|uniref:hypothetical protein n=1 Tax=Haliscomenobacter sp. TaxID=2717303 RepID=UPI003592E8DA